jgi:type I restriction enzyme M protein
MERLGGHWNRYLPLLTAFSQDDLAEYFEMRVGGERLCEGERNNGVSSSLPVAELVTRVLDFKRGESVCDLGCSVGDFLHRAYFAICDDDRDPKCVGYEIMKEPAAMAEVRMACDGLGVQIENTNVFDRKTWGDQFDKVFCEPPFCLRRLPESPLVRDFIHEAFPDFPELSLSMDGDWLFAARAVAALKRGGKAAVILPPPAMDGAAAEPYRRYFIQRNLIEAVVELPARLFEHTTISTYLVIFREGSESVKMVRAEDLCEKGRRNNVMNDGHIRAVMGALGLLGAKGQEEFARYVIEVGKQDLLKNGCDLRVKRHFALPVAIRNGVGLGTFMVSAKRGAPMQSAELDKLACDDETGYRYVSIGNINDGVIDAKLTNLREVPDKYLPYCARNGDLIVSRLSASGTGFKVAVVETPEGKTLLPNGNLFVISVDRKRAEPYFIKACLDSRYAQRYLQNRASGSAILTLNNSDLEDLPIPDLPMARQREIASRCHAKAMAVVKLRDELAMARKSLGCVLDEVASDCFTGKGEA